MHRGEAFVSSVEPPSGQPSLSQFTPFRRLVTGSKSNREGESGANVLDKLDSAEAAPVLRKLLEHHGELRSEAEVIARSILAEVSLFSVADDVENALLQFDYDELNGRAGAHSWGYVEPVGGRRGTIGGRQYCQGIPLGLYRVWGWQRQRHPELGAGLSRGGSRPRKLLPPIAKRLRATRYFPMQKLEKMRLRISSAVVAPVMASMGRRPA